MRKVEAVFGAEVFDPELRSAVDEVDRSLIRLAMNRTVRERLRAGVAMARLAARFRREEAPDRR